MIILLPPSFNHLLSFLPTGKDPSIETVAAKRAVETLDERVLLGAAGLDIKRLTIAIF